MPLGEIFGPIASPNGTSGSGVTAVSVVSANGFAGTSSGGTTPALTLSTTVTGILKGNGTTISAAVAGTDYLTPSGNGSALTGITYSQISGTPSSLPPNGSAGGSLSGTYPNPGLASTITAGGPTGSATVVPVITYNAAGQLTAVTTANITGTVPGGSAGGALAGTYPNPTLASTITAGGPTGSATVVPVITYNAAGQLTTVTTATIAQTTLPTQYTTSTITADPNPAVVGTYYRCNYPGSGNFTLPSTSLTTGQWIKVKMITNHTLSIVGTVDGSSSFTMSQYDCYEFIWNGTNWDIT